MCLYAPRKHYDIILMPMYRKKHPSMIFTKVEIQSDHSVDEDERWKNYERMTARTKSFLVTATSFSTYFSIFLSSTKGRDKFLAFFQYFFDFYKSCAEYSSIEKVRFLYRKRKLRTVLLADNLTENVSKARKVFRLLKFLDEVKGMGRMIRSQKPTSIKYLSVLTHSFSFVYYLLDNVIWLVSVFI
jgi:hypothetical protein